MISAKNIYNSRAYRQLKTYANGDKVLLKRLVEQYVDNYNSRGHMGSFRNARVLSDSFIWAVTKQRHAYWENIQNNTRLVQ